MPGTVGQGHSDHHRAGTRRDWEYCGDIAAEMQLRSVARDAVMSVDRERGVAIVNEVMDPLDGDIVFGQR